MTVCTVISALYAHTILTWYNNTLRIIRHIGIDITFIVHEGSLSAKCFLSVAKYEIALNSKLMNAHGCLYGLVKIKPLLAAPSLTVNGYNWVNGWYTSLKIG